MYVLPSCYFQKVWYNFEKVIYDFFDFLKSPQKKEDHRNNKKT